MTFPLIVGLGSHHGDDRAGWLVVDRLREMGLPPSHLKQALHAAEILDVIDHERNLIVCDACEGENSGTVHHWPWPSKELISLRSRGTHDLGLNEVLNLARHFGQCPPRIEIWAIEGSDWQPTSSPTTAMLSAAAEAAAAIRSRYTHA